MWYLMALYLLHRFIVRLFDVDTPAAGVVYFPVILNSDFKGLIILPFLKSPCWRDERTQQQAPVSN
jgi:hypothetical protein